MVNNNPAGRLQIILAKIQKTNSNESLAGTCSKIFEIDSSDKGQILYALSGVIGLINECKEKTLSLNIEEPEVFVETISNLEEIFSNISLGESINSIQRKIDKSTLTGLKFISHFIERDYSNYNIDEDKLKDLLEDVENLIEQILVMELPKEIKDMFVYNLEKIRSAIINCKIWGFDNIRDYLDAGVGQIFRNKEILEINKTNENVQEIGQKYIAFLGKVDSLITIGSRIKEIVQPIMAHFIG